MSNVQPHELIKCTRSVRGNTLGALCFTFIIPPDEARSSFGSELQELLWTKPALFHKTSKQSCNWDFVAGELGVLSCPLQRTSALFHF